MSQAWGFYLCLSVCICGLIDGAVDEAGGGEARKLASSRVQLGYPRGHRAWLLGLLLYLGRFILVTKEGSEGF